MKKWKEILTDPSAFPDDFTVSLKDGQVMTLGEMRAYDKENEGALTQRLTARETEIAKREKNVNDASVQLATVIEKTAEKAGLSVEDFLQGKAPTKRVVAESADLDENDPLVGKLVKEIRTMQGRVNDLAASNEKLRKDALGPMLNTYLDDYYESKWDKLSPTLPKGATVTREEAIEYANKNGFKDGRGRLDLSKAVKDLTYDARVKADAEKMAGDLRKKDDDARLLASVPKPSSLGTRTVTDKSLRNEKGQTKNFDEVLNDALQDTDLWRGVSGQA